MKKPFLIIPAIALALASCGGGNSNQNGGTATDTTATVETPQCDVSTTTDTVTSANAVTDIKQCIAYEVLLKYAEKYDYPSKQMVEDQFDSEYAQAQLAKDPEFVEASPGDGMMRLHCYPNKNGGYYVVVIFDEVCDCPGAYRYEYFNYKDGNLTKAKSLLPKTTINDFYANADKFPKDVFNILKPRATGNVYHYFYSDSHKLTASFDGFEWDGGYDIPAPLKKYYEEKEASFPSITYIWDGEKFIRDPECEPYEEDLSLFDIESDEVREKKFLANLPKHYTDSVYEFSTESIDEDADFHSGNFDYYFPYKNKEGEYFVLSVFQESSAGASSCDFSSFNYKDGEKKIIEDFLPVPKLSELINPDQREKHPELYNELEQECKDGIQYYSYNYDSYTKSLTLFLFFDDQDLWDKYNELTNGSLKSRYKWNGEKFVKQ